MAEVVVDWLLRELGLTPANALFVGGGRFDLLVPVDVRTAQSLEAKQSEIEQWLVDQFQGVLGLEIVSEQLSAADFVDLRRANAALDDKMAEGKRRKLHRQLPAVLVAKELEQVCQVCGLTPLPRRPEDTEHICEQCHCHDRIGAALPRTSYMVRLYSPECHRVASANSAVTIDFSAPIDTRVLLSDSDALNALLSQTVAHHVETLVCGLNDTPIAAEKWSSSTTPAHIYLANAAPVSNGQVWEFDQIADCSAGTHLLGVLKADIDHLGLVFSLGLEPPTMSRMAALSHTLDRFFSGYLNVLCHHITSEWKNRKKEAKEPYPDDLASLFYVVYAGGDDLLIVGPWNQTVELAARLNEDFRAYTCHNPNITLSAGMVMVKPHYPVQRFVHWVSEALNKSKDNGRDRLTVFDAPAIWNSEGSSAGFDSLQDLAGRMMSYIRTRAFPRTLVHDLHRLSQKEARLADGTTKACVTPELLYLLTRRLPREVRDELKEAILHAWPRIRVPTSYVSLITRKE